GRVTLPRGIRPSCPSRAGRAGGARRAAGVAVHAVANRGVLSMPVSNAIVEITTDLARIDLDRVHEWLAQKSYWAGRTPRSVLQRAVAGSLCFAALEQQATVGFCRVISDG